MSDIANIIDGSEVFLLKSLAKDRILFVTNDDARMERLKQIFSFFLPDHQTLTFPAWDTLPYDRISPNSDIISSRVNLLCKLQNLSGKVIIITTVNAVLQKIPSRKFIASSSFCAKKGDNVSRTELVEKLEKLGYSRSANVNEPGEYAIRGSIIDIFDNEEKRGIRLDFFGDEIENLRVFDPLSQLSGTKIDEFMIKPASEILLTDEAIERFKRGYIKLFGMPGKDDQLFSHMEQKRKFAGFEQWLPLFHEELEDISYYTGDYQWVIDANCNHLMLEREEKIRQYYQSRIDYAEEGKKSGAIYNPLPPEEMYVFSPHLPLEEARLERRGAIELSRFDIAQGESLSTHIRMGDKIYLLAKEQNITIADALKSYLKDKKGKRLIACYSEGSRSRIRNMLSDHEMHVMMVESFVDVANISGKTMGLFICPLENSLVMDDMIIVSEQDLLDSKLTRKSRQSAAERAKSFMEEANGLIEGEVIVHKEHGIGRFEGLETLTVLGESHDCLKLIYDAGDKLYIPVENIELISKFGGDTENIPLDRLGSISWQSRKARLKNRIREIAAELIKIAAERMLKKAEPIEKDGLYQEFCNFFPYAETEDQLRAIEDIENDLFSGRPMDRLICGDAGFGKTEVALRAAFLAAKDGMQVAMIAPTTLLARQHYSTFRERFQNFPLKIRGLSRMIPAKEAAETKKMMEDGAVDIVIGTHALLAKDIKFKNLGMLIVDEEQSFGVAQKERLKQLKSDIHVLTLSATPIPRTLQMALAGIREMSLVATPPIDRIAIRSFVMPYDPVIIREAIIRERTRGGRIFYVAPRIADLDDLAEKLDKIAPEIKYVKAHGKLAATELDDIMNKFYDGTYDLLLSTSIIESGIDIPFANTIIIHRADMFGLAQLYQLRGRVGRSNLRGYAYLTLPQNRSVSKIAEQRLNVMRSLDGLGAGFTIASSDMDIRGVGNLLGDEQSGHIREVGAELYQEMLEDAINNMNDKIEEEKDFSPQINIGLSILIPESYVSDINLRLGLYKRAGNLKTAQEVEEFAAELIDRFGEIPAETEHLLEIVKIKQLCAEIGIEKLDAGNKGIVITFFKNNFRNPSALIELVSKHSTIYKLRPDQKLVMIKEMGDNESKLKASKELLEIIRKLYSR